MLPFPVGHSHASHQLLHRSLCVSLFCFLSSSASLGTLFSRPCWALLVSILCASPADLRSDIPFLPHTGLGLISCPELCCCSILSLGMIPIPLPRSGILCVLLEQSGTEEGLSTLTPDFLLSILARSGVALPSRIPGRNLCCPSLVAAGKARLWPGGEGSPCAQAGWEHSAGHGWDLQMSQDVFGITPVPRLDSSPLAVPPLA